MIALYRLAPLAAIAALGICACASGPRPPNPGAPPQEAIDACQGKNEGEECSAKGGLGEMKGKCAKGPDEKVACRPEGGPGGSGGPAGHGGPGGPGGPPPGPPPAGSSTPAAK